MRKLILAVVVWMGGNCAIAQDLDEIIYRGLDDIRHELFLQRLEGSGSYSGPGGGLYYPYPGYFQQPTYYPSKKAIRAWNKRDSRIKHAAAVRAGTAKPIKRTVVKTY